MSETVHDYVIVGAGPAGLQLGYFLKKSGRDFVILEAGDSVGSFFKQFPRHRKLISANKVYTGYDDPIRNLRWDWNSLIADGGSPLFKEYSREYFPPADQMVTYLEAFARHHELPIKLNTRVERISRDGDFKVHTADGQTLLGRRLVMATGVSKPYLPPIEGIEHAELYGEMSTDPEDFSNQRVLVLGKGNSAFETADNLIATASRIYVCSPTPITLSWKSKFVGHLRAVNNNFIDTYQLKLQNVMLDAKLLKIEKNRDGKLVTTFHYAHADDEVETMEFDRVLICTGFRFDASIFDDDCKPGLAINGRFPVQTSGFESVNVKDLFFAGTVMQERDFKKKQSGFIHGFRHNVESLAHMLEERYHGVKWPSRALDPTPQALAAAVLERANHAPGLWQQTGFICDVVARSIDGKRYEYFEDVMTQYAHDVRFRDREEYYVVTLEFGLDLIYASPDPLSVNRIHKDDVENANLSTGIHPIIRRYSYGRLTDEHHVLEDIIPEWDEPESHIKPLERFFTKGSMLGKVPATPAATGKSTRSPIAAGF
jgi:thioredoxin reductase